MRFAVFSGALYAAMLMADQTSAVHIHNADGQFDQTFAEVDTDTVTDTHTDTASEADVWVHSELLGSAEAQAQNMAAAEAILEAQAKADDWFWTSL